MNLIKKEFLVMGVYNGNNISLDKINQWADFWYYKIGVNVLPFDTQKRIPIIYQYEIYQNEPIPIEVYEQWKREGKFEKGIAIILGKVYRGKNEGQYLIGIDIDKEKGLREFLTKNNKQTDLHKFSEKTIVEQHADELHRAHIYFYSPIPFPKKSSDSILGLEVKGGGGHGIMFVSPSIHKYGFNYEIIGNAKEPPCLSSQQAIELMRHIDNICSTYGLKYLETEKNKILTEPLKKIIRTLKLEPEFQHIIAEGQRHITMLSFADSLLIKHRNKKSKEVLKTLFLLVNDNVCFSPLPENEINSIWESADEFVDDLEIHDQKNRSFSEKQSLIENATDQIMSKYRFLTIEHTKEILFYNNNGVYVEGGEILIEKELESIFGFELRGADISEIKGHIIRKSYVKREKFDSNLDIVNLKNGLYNMRTGKLEPHSPDYYSLNQKPFPYNPKVRPKYFIKFLKEVLYVDDILTAIDIIAYTFLRYNPQELYFILIGVGANGKSVYTGLLTNLHGVKNVSNVSLNSLVNNPFALADLENKDVNIDTELSSNSIKDMSVLKKLTGNHPIRIERKNQQAYDTILHAKSIFNANQLPISPDHSDAHFRREIILSFPNQFEGGKEDPDLLNKLSREEELSGIFNIIAIALRRIIKTQRIHINEKTIKERREKAELIYDAVGSFLKDAVAEDSIESNHVIKDNFYIAYTRFCKFHKLPVEQKETFGKILKQKHNYQDGRGTKGERKTIWKGIRLIKWNNNDPLQEVLILSNDK
jgi:P4 family phage/plasmid primase-like protien